MQKKNRSAEAENTSIVRPDTLGRYVEFESIE